MILKIGSSRGIGFVTGLMVSAGCVVAAAGGGCGTRAAVSSDARPSSAGGVPGSWALVAESVGVIGTGARRFGLAAIEANTPAYTGMRQQTNPDDGFDAEPAVSPDGRWFAYASTRHSRRSNLYLQRTDGVSAVRLTDTSGDDTHPTFSPDGQWIAFASNRSGFWNLYLLPTDGSAAVRRLTDSRGHELHPTFSPDGRRLAFCSPDRYGEWYVWTLDLTTGRRQTVGPGLFPAWSPVPGRDVLAFQRARQRGTETYAIWTCELIGGEAGRLTEVAASPNAAFVEPAWSPDGSRLAFTSIVPGPTPQDPTLRDVWTIDADGRDRRRVTDGVGWHSGPTFSPDGRLWFASNRTGPEGIWSVAVPRVTVAEPTVAAVEP